MQEVLHNQLEEILGALNQADHGQASSHASGPYWSYIGVAREDDRQKGEYSPILYPTKVFKLLHFENIWLSPTPGKPSKGWDAGSERILTIGIFEHKVSKRRLATFNTHLDNAGSEARKNSVAMIIDKIEQIRAAWDPTVANKNASFDGVGLNYFLAGDFNSFPTQGR